MAYEITIKKCGQNSVLGTLYNSDMCSTIQMDGLKGLRQSLEARKTKLQVSCFLHDKREIVAQLKALKFSMKDHIKLIIPPQPVKSK